MASSPTASERRARELLEQLGIEEPPVPVEGIPRELDARLIYEAMDGDVSGMLLRHVDGPTVIGVNSNHHRNRQRFTIAHELGHLLLHEDDAVFVDKQLRIEFRDERASLAVDRKEIAANAFAAELLMPEDMIVEVADSMLEQEPNLDGDRLINRLASRFEVSAQAMQFRLTNLDYWAPL